MKPKLEYFRTFYDETNLIEFKEFLRLNSIKYSVHQPSRMLDSNIIGSGGLQGTVIKIYNSDFQKVNSLLLEKIKSMTDEQIENNVLYTYDDESLLNIIENPEGSTIEEIEISSRILNGRGLSSYVASIDENVKKGVNSQKGNLFWQFLYLLFVTGGHYVSILFPLAGIGMGYYYSFGMKISVNGEKVYRFESSTRLRGKVIFYGGILFALTLFYYIYNSDYWTYYTDNLLFHY